MCLYCNAIDSLYDCFVMSECIIYMDLHVYTLPKQTESYYCSDMELCFVLLISLCSLSADQTKSLTCLFDNNDEISGY